MRDTRRTRIVLAALLTLALVLLAADFLRGSAQLRSTSGAVFGTAARAVQSVTGPMTGLLRSGGSSGSSRSASALQAELIKLRARLNSGQLSASEQARLATLLQLPGRGRYRIAGADVIAVGRGSRQTVTLDVGRRAGIRPNTTVINASGLVGRVTSVSRWTCTVLLATAKSAVVGVRIAGSGQLGWVTGRGSNANGPNLLRLRLVGAGNSLVPGQRLVTFASVGGRPYVGGVPVGVVTRVAPATGSAEIAQVRPFANFSALGVVGVVRPGGRS
ncbi:MAG TPA: rod shape-determining protein MreC [Streptosporangiaceae bacterium]|nr:rod shape-determining protein MreC [Streptosporangiaceae bacterium]